MENQEKHVEVYSGSPVLAMAVKNALEENNIEYIERNDIDSAIAAGYGTVGRSVHIFVYLHDETKAKELIETLDLS